MKKRKGSIILVLCMGLLVQSLFGRTNDWEKIQASEKDFLFSLTLEEEAYLQTLREEALTLAVAEASAYQTDAAGDAAWGMAVPLIELLEYEFGLEIEVFSGTWAESKEALMTGEADMLFGIPVVSGQETVPELEGSELLYSTSLYEEEVYLAARKGAAYEELYRSEGVRLGIVGDSFWAAQLWQLLYFAEELVSFADTEAMIKALTNQEIEAAVLPEGELTALFAYEELAVAASLLPKKAEITLGVVKPELTGLLKLLNRYLLETEEGDAMRAAIQAERLRGRLQYVAACEQELLKYVKNRYAVLSYTMLSAGSIPMLWEENGEKTGLLAELMECMEELTGIPAEYIEVRNDAEAASLLEEGELVLLAGLVQNAQSSEELFFSKALGAQKIVPVLSKAEAERFAEATKEGSTAEEQLAYCYWGTQADVFPFLSGTAFDGHTVVFGSEEELFDAFREGMIGGMLLKEGVYAYQWENTEAELLETFSYTVPEQLIFYSGNEELNTLLKRLMHIYEILYPTAWEHWQEEAAEWQEAELLLQQEKRECTLYLALVACGVIIALLFVCVLWKRKQE